MKTALGINKENRHLLDSLNRWGKKIFSIKEAAAMMQRSTQKSSFYLAYFARRGWLSRVKRGLYISVPLGTINPQEYKENPWVVANRIFSPCYAGGCSAAEHWGLTEQIFNSVFIFTSRTFRSKAINIQGTDYVLKLVRDKSFNHTKIVWIENTKMQVSDPTQTIIDMLDDPSCGGGIRHVAEIIETYCHSEHYREDDLLIYAKEKGNRTIYKRLGYILEAFDIKLSRVIEECRKNISTGYSTLDPTIKGKGTFSRRWNLKVNAEVKK